MARKSTYKTRSQTGEMILGFLLLLIGAFGLCCPCMAMLGSLFGQVASPKGSQDLLGTLFALGVLLALAVVCLALGVLCLHATLLPKTLHIEGDGLRLFWGSRQLGAIPFANLKGVIVKTREMAGQTAGGAFLQGFLAGGLIGGFMARSNFNPDEPIGIVLRLLDGDDPDTFWPRAAGKKRLEMNWHWSISYPTLVQKINDALSRYKRRLSRGRTPADPGDDYE